MDCREEENKDIEVSQEATGIVHLRMIMTKTMVVVTEEGIRFKEVELDGLVWKRMKTRKNEGGYPGLFPLP